MRTDESSQPLIKCHSGNSNPSPSGPQQRRSDDDQLSAEVLDRIHRASASHQADEMFDKLADGKPSRSELSREDVWARLQQGTVR